MIIKIPNIKMLVNQYESHDPLEIDLGPDVVPVIRCQDCRFYREDKYGTHWCSIGCEVHHVRPDDFCSFGEREEGAD